MRRSLDAEDPIVLVLAGLLAECGDGRFQSADEFREGLADDRALLPAPEHDGGPAKEAGGLVGVLDFHREEVIGDQFRDQGAAVEVVLEFAGEQEGGQAAEAQAAVVGELGKVSEVGNADAGVGTCDSLELFFIGYVWGEEGVRTRRVQITSDSGGNSPS